MKYFFSIIVLFGLGLGCNVFGQSKSIARQWNEVLLEGIRNDFARPTIHARNLFHVSAAMYDAWAVFEPSSSTYFLGNTVHGYEIPFDGFDYNETDKSELQQRAISYAVYRLMEHRFAESPGYEEIISIMDGQFDELGYDKTFVDTDYSNGSAAALGNYIAQQIKLYGYQDGANEIGNYESLYYETLNEPLDLSDEEGSNYLKDPNRWQPLQFENFIDQGGNVIGAAIIDFLSPEWGDVNTFSMGDEVRETLERDGSNWNVFHNPGHPPYIDSVNHLALEDNYKWGFTLVSIWSSHLDPTDGVQWDISPAGIGNIALENIPTNFDDFSNFYELLNGGDISTGYDLNPVTNEPYATQMVSRGDYARVLAEFWADGPDSETPPGHWFVILNYVMDQPEFNYKWEGRYDIDPLEFDVKAYFTLGGTMHDVAISSWSVKGFYDFIRPISAIRFMATRGQSSDRALPNYDSLGIPLVEGYVEVIEEGDLLAGENGEYINEIKLLAWRGHQFVEDPDVDQAGVGWIRAKQWWPYQRPSFVTPPFAGFVSGHSTYSRAAAEVLTLITGSEYFPGGLGEFHAPKNEFLVFEEGPSEDVVLQWAKYSDASDQCSLSRIWGGIHPPADDLPGRLMGSAIGKSAFEFASLYFGQILSTEDYNSKSFKVYPNPAKDHAIIGGKGIKNVNSIALIDLYGKVVEVEHFTILSDNRVIINFPTFFKGVYFIKIDEKAVVKVILD